MLYSQITTSPVARHCILSLTLLLTLPTAMAQKTARDETPQLAVTSVEQAAKTGTKSLVLARGPAGVTITVNDVLADLQRLPEASRQVMMALPDNVKQIASNLLVRRVLAKEAERDGAAEDGLVSATIAISRDRALSEARLSRLDAQNTPSETALDAYARNVYRANASKFEKPAETRVSHILLANNGLDSLNKAKELVAQLHAGASFEELAKTNSIDPGSAARGGDLGFFTAGKMVRPFDDAVNALAKPGDLSEPIETQFGYHIIRLEERHDKGRATYEDVREQLLKDAHIAILNDARGLKVLSMSKEFIFDQSAIESLSKPSKP